MNNIHRVLVGHTYPYRTPASFGKAKSKVENALPKSPRKRTAVLAKLAGGLQVTVVVKPAPNAIDPTVKSAIIS